MNYSRLLITAILALLPAGKALAVDQAEPLACDSKKPTYYPRGDHWAKSPDGAAREYHIQKDGAPNISQNVVRSTIDSAFNYWTGLTCNDDGNNNTPLNVSWKRGGDWSSKDRGDNVDKGEFNNVIYFITEANAWQKATGADSLTIALATNLQFWTTGYIVSSDIEFNAGNFAFRAGGGGCSASQKSPPCYDLTAIATHEVGHWFGFNHVNCTDAVMYPTATTTKTMGSKLPVHEATGACKVYNPQAKSSSYAAQWGEECTDNSQCPGGTCIVEYLGTHVYGWCTKKCTSDSQCPEAYFCNTEQSADAGGTATRYCKPGHRWGGHDKPDPTDYSKDLCKPCNTGADCASEMCVLGPDGDKSYCSAPCVPGSADLGCESGYNCLPLDTGAGACWPASGSCDNSHSTTEYCGLNEMCWDYSDDSYCGCESGLICFAFRNFGECVPLCGDGIECPGSNYTCCYAIDENGNCLTQHSAGQYGGCFDIRDENETCLRGDESICGSSLLCAQLENTVAEYCGIDWTQELMISKCYKLCSDKDQCAAGQSCNLCLEVSPGVGLCWPPDPSVTQLKRPLGAVCSENNQCASELCMTNGEKKACSQACSYYTDSGCPAAGVNELGLEFKCERIGTTTDGFCWPKNDPVDVAGDNPIQEEEEIYGCDCRQGMRDPMSWLMIGLLALMVFRRQRKPQV